MTLRHINTFNMCVNTNHELEYGMHPLSEQAHLGDTDRDCIQSLTTFNDRQIPIEV